MRPSQASAALRQIASRIDHSKRPDRSLVARALRRVLAAVSPRAAVAPTDEGVLAQVLARLGVAPTASEGSMARFEGAPDLLPAITRIVGSRPERDRVWNLHVWDLGPDRAVWLKAFRGGAVELGVGSSNPWGSRRAQDAAQEQDAEEDEGGSQDAGGSQDGGEDDGSQAASQ